MTEWIPVSEQLPPINTPILVSLLGGAIVVTFYTATGAWMGLGAEPDAWMLAPKPYEVKHD